MAELAYVVSELKDELSKKKKGLKEITRKQLEGKNRETWKTYKRMLSVDILLLNGIINRSPKSELKMLQTKYREAMVGWMELSEENSDEGYYLKLANDCKEFNEYFDDLIKLLGV
jgi:hypothetical protein